MCEVSSFLDGRKEKTGGPTHQVSGESRRVLASLAESTLDYVDNTLLLEEGGAMMASVRIAVDPWETGSPRQNCRDAGRPTDHPARREGGGGLTWPLYFLVSVLL